MLDEFEPDACLVMAYGQIIKAPHLARCPQRWLNLHGSLLPRWRGAAPIERCLEAGDIETGIQLMQMETGLDTGAVYAERRIATKGHNAQTLSQALAIEAAALTRSSLVEALHGSLEPVPQDPHRACYAKRIEKSEGMINFLGSADLWARRSRAFNPRLGLRCRIKSHKKDLSLKIWDAEVVADQGATEPGAILRADQHGLWVSCEVGVLNILSLQFDGKKRLDWSQFKTGLALEPNDRFA